MINKSYLINYVNANGDETDFYDLNYYLKRNKINNKICLVGFSNIKVCNDLRYYLVEPNLNMYHSNVVNIKSKVSGGDILYVHDNVSLAELKVVINEIKYKGLTIVHLNDLIKE